MGDIFDDVEKLLANEEESESTMESTSVTPHAEDESQIFNENELEDIMAEIESLEKDFESTTPGPSIEVISTIVDPVENVNPEELKLDSSNIAKTDLQKVIDNELESIEIANELESIEKTEAIKGESETVLAFEKKPSKRNTNIICFEDLLNYSYPTNSETTTNTLTSAISTPVIGSKSEMSFSASGMMNVNLTFKVGSEEAKLFIDEEKGLVVSMSGVEVCLNEINGCTVSMENGANFTIPLTQKNSSTTKKAA